MERIAGFLRGINVGGHHKVSMAELHVKLSTLGCMNVKTLLNSGNFVFESAVVDLGDLEINMEAFLSDSFGFYIPTLLKPQSDIHDLLRTNPFGDVVLHEDIKLYVSFLKNEPKRDLILPYYSEDCSFKILHIKNRTAFSTLDLSTTKTPKGMNDLEKILGNQITTRNWNTIRKVNDILQS